MKKYLSISLVLFCLFALCACTSPAPAPSSAVPTSSTSPDSQVDALKPYFTGKVLEIYDGTSLLEVTDVGNENFYIGMTVVVNTNVAKCPDFSVGDLLTVSFDGTVTLSLPPRVLNVFQISKSQPN